MRCPACKSESVRRSRRRPPDGQFRTTFFKAYRCRKCRTRFFRLANAPVVGAVVAASVLAVFGLGIAAGRLLGGPPPGIEAATDELSPSAGIAGRGAGDSPAPPGGDFGLLSAAEEGDAKAQYQVGVAYLKGEGITPDLTLAYKWIEKSALQGYAEAQFALGHMHQGGRGALQSFPLAFKWYEQAAHQDHAEAQYRIGLMYRTGQGIPMDKPTAYVWFVIAAAQGHDRARDARDNLQPALNPEQLKEAQHLAQAWRPVVAKQ
jgi:hypothetical protein